MVWLGTIKKEPNCIACVVPEIETLLVLSKDPTHQKDSELAAAPITSIYVSINTLLFGETTVGPTFQVSRGRPSAFAVGPKYL